MTLPIILEMTLNSRGVWELARTGTCGHQIFERPDRPRTFYCPTCDNARNAKWRANNPERNAKKNAEWKEANPGYDSEQSAKWRDENGEQIWIYNIRNGR